MPLGIDTNEFCIAALDTGTVRHGLEKSTYAVRVKEPSGEEFVRVMEGSLDLQVVWSLFSIFFREGDLTSKSTRRQGGGPVFPTLAHWIQDGPMTTQDPNADNPAEPLVS